MLDVSEVHGCTDINDLTQGGTARPAKLIIKFTL